MVTTDLKSFAFPSPDSVCLTSSVFAVWKIYLGAISSTFRHLLKTRAFKVAFKIDFVQYYLMSLAFEFFKVLEPLQDRLATRIF